MTLKDYEKSEIETLLWTAKDLKCRLGSGEIYEPLKGKVASLIFQKRSTRTRLSSETGALFHTIVLLSFVDKM